MALDWRSWTTSRTDNRCATVSPGGVQLAATADRLPTRTANDALAKAKADALSAMESAKTLAQTVERERKEAMEQLF